MTTLPRPDVSVTESPGKSSGETKIDVVISRDNKAKTYTGKGTTTQAVHDIVREIIDNPATAEILP